MRVKPERTTALDIHPSIIHAMNVADRVWRRVCGVQARCTGLQEEGHSKDSLHYGTDGDIRCRAFDLDADAAAVGVAAESEANQRRNTLLVELKRRLGSEFDVILEGVGTRSVHFHIEYDPK